VCKSINEKKLDFLLTITPQILVIEILSFNKITFFLAGANLRPCLAKAAVFLYEKIISSLLHSRCFTEWNMRDFYTLGVE